MIGNNQSFEQNFNSMYSLARALAMPYWVFLRGRCGVNAIGVNGVFISLGLLIYARSTHSCLMHSFFFYFMFLAALKFFTADRELHSDSWGECMVQYFLPKLTIRQALYVECLWLLASGTAFFLMGAVPYARFLWFGAWIMFMNLRLDDELMRRYTMRVQDAQIEAKVMLSVFDPEKRKN